MIGIYSITNKINNKIYIGQSINIESRWSHHRNELNNNKHRNCYLQNSWNKYGESNFEFNIVYKTNSEDLKNLNEKELYYINKYESMYNKNGYNIKGGGDVNEFSYDTKSKLRNSRKANGQAFLTDEQVRQIKLMLWCLMDKKEISKIFNVNIPVIKNIANGICYTYVLENLNCEINNMKSRLISERNEFILKKYNDGEKIIDIHKKYGYTVSVIEHCIYENIGSKKESDKLKRQEIYDKVMKLYNDGIIPYKISKILNIGNSTVRRYIKGEVNPYL